MKELKIYTNNLLYEIISELDKVFFCKELYKFSNIQSDEFYLVGIKSNRVIRESDGKLLRCNYFYIFCNKGSEASGYEKVEQPTIFSDLSEDKQKLVMRLDCLLESAILLLNYAKIVENDAKDNIKTPIL